MNPRKQTALALMIILGLFIAALTAGMLVTRTREARAGVLAETELTRLKDQIKATPKVQTLIDQARALDAQMMQDYFRVRRQYKVGAYLLAIAVIGFMMSAAMLLEAAPEPLPDLAVLSKGISREVATARGRRAALAVAALSLFTFIGLAASGVHHAGDLPPVEKKIASASTVNGGQNNHDNRATSATLASAPATTATLVAAATPKPTAATPTAALTATSSSTQAATNPEPQPTTIAPAAVAKIDFKENWPCLRGEGNLGFASKADYPTTWDAKTGKNIAWSVAVPFEGKSSPVVWGDKVFVTGGDKTEHIVIAFDRATGKPLWTKKLTPPPGTAEMEIFEDTGFAAITPATDGQHVYAMFASGLIVALDPSGNPVWTTTIEKPDSQYGLASSLIVHQGTLIILLDQGPEAEAKKSKLLGLDAATGKEKWSTPRPVPNSWASPSIAKTAAGKFELITEANPLVIGYDPADGKELWRVDGYGGEIAPSAAFDGERFIVANDSACALAIKPGGAGDVTQTHVAWRIEETLPDIVSPLADGKRLLLVKSSGDTGCFASATGKKLWEKNFECSFSASPILAGKFVYLPGQDGKTRVIELNDAAYKQVGEGDIGEPINVTPAFGDGQIYIRGAKHLICVAGAKAPATMKVETTGTTGTTPTAQPLTEVKSTTATVAAPAAAAVTTATLKTAASMTSTSTSTSTNITTATTPAAGIPAAQAGAPAPAFKEAWPCLRGAGNIGWDVKLDSPTAWNVKAGQNVAWSTAISAEAEGKSSPVVWGDKVFLTGGNKSEHHLIAYDRASGAVAWDKKLTPPPGTAELEIFDDTGFAAITPATDGQRVYAMYASGLLVAFDFAGNQAWTMTFEKPDSQYGLASSLIVHEGILIVQLDQGPEAEAKKSKILGLDAATGKEKWSTPRPVPNSWASPSIIKTPAGKFELITLANPLVIAYDPASGKELWRLDGYGGEIAPSPAYDGQRIIISNDSAATLAIKPGGSGDVTQSALAWRTEEGMPDVCSPVADAKRVLLVKSSGDMSCFGTADGKKLWEKNFDCSFSASPILAGKYVYLCGQDGRTRVIELGDAAYKQVGEGDVGEPINVTPAFGDGRIYIRGSKHLFCIGAK